MGHVCGANVYFLRLVTLRQLMTERSFRSPAGRGGEVRDVWHVGRGLFVSWRCGCWPCQAPSLPMPGRGVCWLWSSARCAPWLTSAGLAGSLVFICCTCLKTMFRRNHVPKLHGAGAKPPAGRNNSTGNSLSATENPQLSKRKPLLRCRGFETTLLSKRHVGDMTFAR